MSEVEIVNTKANGIIEVDGTVFYPGANRVSSERVARLLELSYFLALITRGFLVVAQAPEVEEQEAPAAGAVFSLKGLKPDAVKSLVEGSSDLAQLRAWLNTDGRAQTRKLIEARAAALLAAAKDKDNADRD